MLFLAFLYTTGEGLRKCRENSATTAPMPIRQAMQNGRPPNTLDLGQGKRNETKGSKWQGQECQIRFSHVFICFFLMIPYR